jgi:ArsR family transcriptional regulator
MVDAMTIESMAVDGNASVALLQALADPIRWTILHTLASRPSCVCQLQEHVPIAANLLSYHLKVLREAGLVTSAKRGRWVDYALADDASARMRAALPDVMAGPVRCAPGDLAGAREVSP